MKIGMFNKCAMLTGTAKMQQFGGRHYGKKTCDFSEALNDFNVSMKNLKKLSPPQKKELYGVKVCGNTNDLFNKWALLFGTAQVQHFATLRTSKKTLANSVRHVVIWMFA